MTQLPDFSRFIHRFRPQLRSTLPLLMTAVSSILFAALADWQSPDWRYQREAVLQGEIWRLVTGHFVHLGASHLLLNLAGLGLVAMLFGPGLNRTDWWWLLTGALAAMAAGFLVLEPQLVWYVGLSGLLHGLILGGAVLDLGFGCRARMVLIGVVLVKLAWEQVYGALPFTADAAGGPVVVAAHLYGGLGGLLAGALRYWQAGWRAQV